jgi:hypothetical protein
MMKIIYPYKIALTAHELTLDNSIFYQKHLGISYENTIKNHINHINIKFQNLTPI